MKPMDFQKATAERIFQIFRDEGQSCVLLADEVGLGKTIIASAVVKLISQWHKAEGDNHFKVVYICSNMNIANQNCRKLGIPEEDCLDFSESRLSMQHLRLYETEGRDYNYEQLIPMTPATSFSMKGGQGTQYERALIYEILRHHPLMKPLGTKLKQLMQFEKTLLSWDWYIDHYRQRVRACDKANGHYISDMLRALDEAFAHDPELLQKVSEICASRNVMQVPYARRRDAVNALRQVFARISLERLEPDFVIMDEFQRFKDLIADRDSEQKMLAKKFLSDSGVKVLLLSATPYKPYSTLEELADGGESHYQEFMDVMDFLFRDDAKQANFREVWRDYANHLAEIRTDDLSLLIARKNNAQDALYQCVCRTERMSDAIFDRNKAAQMQLLPEDVVSYTEIQRLMDSLGLGKFPVDYVKSAPYLLSFMNYKVKDKIVQKLNAAGDYRLVERSDTLLLRRKRLNRYEKIPCNNSRLQTLWSEAFGRGRNGAELLLWIPASRPYYKTDNVFSRNAGYSKTLVFSSWEMVPRMIAGLTSYEAERLTLGRLSGRDEVKDKRYFAQEEPAQEKRRRRAVVYRLRDDMAKVLTYPCHKLARLYEPLQLGGKSLDEVRSVVGKEVKALVTQFAASRSLKPGRRSAGQIVALMQALDGLSPDEELHGIPSGAEDLLTELAIGSPAICAYRLFRCHPDAVKHARGVAEKFVALFNKQESAAIIDVLYSKRQDDDAYYENVVSYCVEGNLQAVLDEYAFMLGSEGAELAGQMTTGFSDTASIQIDSRESFLGKREKPRLRTHFAVGYFNAQVSEKTMQRTENIRTAFNSPFRPFVLATTSIGQEGLDFHPYCRKIMHWNLPANPIDLEQREGRINRYLCHAIRQNLAESEYGIFPFNQTVWSEIMQRASEGLKGGQSDLVPYWYLPDDFPFTRKIERIVPMYPYSQDGHRYDRLLEVLSVYRLTLGQPKQEELFEAIKKECWNEDELQQLYINLSPWFRQAGNQQSAKKGLV